ncbi:hypothetical protein JCM10914_3511 [Paenibacillus sp. JCM 10914]|nr:hypothetical protein JCM10914_3511 [Paenibacillus sp. JCM 10914]
MLSKLIQRHFSPPLSLSVYPLFILLFLHCITRSAGSLSASGQNRKKSISGVMQIRQMLI